MITFVKTRHYYESYTDFWQLVKLSNFPVIYVDELDVSRDGIYITCPINGDPINPENDLGEWRTQLRKQQGKPRNSHLILWDLERPLPRGGMSGYSRYARSLFADRSFDEIWTSDKQLASDAGLTFIILGSDERLAIPGDSQKKHNFCHMSYQTDRRKRIYNLFPQETIGPNCWSPERDSVLRQSRFALNVHQDNHPYQEPLRFALFAAYSLPILSETIFDSYPWSDEFMVTVEYDDLGQRMNEMLGDNYSHWQQMGLKAKERMCVEFNFKRQVEEAVRKSVGWR